MVFLTAETSSLGAVAQLAPESVGSVTSAIPPPSQISALRASKHTDPHPAYLANAAATRSARPSLKPSRAGDGFA